jgi:hypothetical protein
MPGWGSWYSHKEEKMDPSTLIPIPDTIPAPPWLFDLLDVSLFFVHIVLVNIVVGGALIALFSASRTTPGAGTKLPDILDKRLPLFLPFAITIGIAPLLFLQVVYGHFFYTSSVLMASYWIAVIPLLIVAYYGIYVYGHRIGDSPRLARLALAASVFFFFYIGFVYVNNFTLMVQPDRWGGYFHNRSGTLLNLYDPVLLPRYLHFIVASVAVAALFMSVLWSRRSSKELTDYSTHIKSGLRLFGVATLLQVGVGVWFLAALPSPIMHRLLGQDLFKTALLLTGALLALGAAACAFGGRLRVTVIQAMTALLFMVITRYNVRSFYLEPYFNFSQLKMAPQYGVLATFLVVLVAGLAVVLYMVRISFPSASKPQEVKIGGQVGETAQEGGA